MIKFKSLVPVLFLPIFAFAQTPKPFAHTLSCLGNTISDQQLRRGEHEKTFGKDAVLRNREGKIVVFPVADPQDPSAFHFITPEGVYRYRFAFPTMENFREQLAELESRQKILDTLSAQAAKKEGCNPEKLATIMNDYEHSLDPQLDDQTKDDRIKKKLKDVFGPYPQSFALMNKSMDLADERDTLFENSPLKKVGLPLGHYEVTLPEGKAVIEPFLNSSDGKEVWNDVRITPVTGTCDYCDSINLIPEADENVIALVDRDIAEGLAKLWQDTVNADAGNFLVLKGDNVVQILLDRQTRFLSCSDEAGPIGSNATAMGYQVQEALQKLTQNP